MKIAVIAANGRSGKIFVEEALAAGHTVRAGVYSHNNLDTHPNLTVVKCDATSKSDLRNLVKGQDVVVSLIGHVKGSPEHLQTDTMKALSAAMKAENIKRCVSLTGTGVRFPGDKITLIDRLLNTAISIIDPIRIRDGKDHVAFLQQSQLEWTVLRVLKLQNIKPRAFRLSQNGPTKSIVGRHEVAQAILQLLKTDSFIRQAPMISKV